MIECVVAAMILVTVISFVASLAFRIGLVWKDTAHHRVAINELSNQLERLTLLSPDEIVGALNELRPTRYASETLPRPELMGRWIEDEWGGRIVLRLSWHHHDEGKSVEMIGWLATAEGQSGVSNPGNTPDDQSAQRSSALNTTFVGASDTQTLEAAR